MSLLHNYVNTLRKRYATFRGRANRKEYFGGFLLVYFILQLFGVIVFHISCAKLSEQQKVAISEFDIDEIAQIPNTILLGFSCRVFLMLPHFLPIVGLVVRRGHDLGISAWWTVSVCLLAWGPPKYIIFAMLGLLPGTPKPNQYGCPPAKKDKITPASYLLVGLLCIHTLIWFFQ